jgi:poly(hydroxyalkanoate) depolymerase family esterase
MTVEFRSRFGMRRAGRTESRARVSDARRLGLRAVAACAVACVAMALLATAGDAMAAGRMYKGRAGSLTYLTYVPSGHHRSRMPLVVALHGCTQSADQFRRQTRWDRLAQTKGFIVVFPQQSRANNFFKCWDFFQANHMKRGSGEPSLIARITRRVRARYAVDPKRIYIAGFSAGGAMTSVMAATYPDLYAAAGIGSGCEYAATAACAGYQGIDPNSAGQQAYAAMGSHARPMPVIAFQGDQDRTVPPVNGQQVVQQWQVTDRLAGDGTTNSAFPGALGGKVSYGRAPGGRSYTTRTYMDGHNAELIQYWVVSGMGHAWSGGASTATYSDPAGPNETAAMYAFFMNHPKP